MIQTNKENKPLSTERKQISNKINDLSIDKKKKLNNNDIFDFGRFNTNNLINNGTLNIDTSGLGDRGK